MIPETHWAWLGGLIDGEGTITCVFRNRGEKRNVRARICVYNTQVELLEAILARFKVGVIYTHRRSPVENQKLTAYEWRINNTEALWLLPLVRPWLILKAKQCDLLIDILQRKETLHPRTWKGNFAGFAAVAELNDELRQKAEIVQLMNRKGLRKNTTAYTTIGGRCAVD